MKNSTDIIYSGFYDVPLAFVVSYHGNQFLFMREFDEVLDDYPDLYRVFRLPNLAEAEIKRQWNEIEKQAIEYFGEVPVEAVRFDQSKRKRIGTEVLLRFVNLHRPTERLIS